MLDKLFALIMAVISFLFPVSQIDGGVAVLADDEAVVAQEAPAQGLIRVESVTGKAGEPVEVGIYVDENPGFVGLRIFVGYDGEVMTLTNAVDCMGENISTFGKDYSMNPYTLLWVDSLRETDYTATGKIASLTFDISDTAASGSYEIKVTIDEGSTFNVDLDDVSFAVENGTLTVEKADAPVKLVPSENATTVIDGENGYIYGLATGLDEETFRNSYVAVEGNGELAISYVSGIGTGSVVTLRDSDSGETVASYEIVIFGDFNGDGNITATDVTALKGIIGGSASVEDDSAQSFALDVSGDGIITSTDLVILKAVVSGAREMDQILK